MIGDRAAIAVLGPTSTDNVEQTTSVAASVGAELARLGYALVTHGDGIVARAAIAGARSGDGRVHAVVYPGSDELDPDSADVDLQSAVLTSLDRVLNLSDAVIMLPGGLASTALMLQVLVFGETTSGAYRQTIIVGGGWTGHLGKLGDALALTAKQRAMLTFAETPKEAVEALRYYVSATA